VVFALWKAGDRNRSDDARVADVERETAAVRGVVGVRQSVLLDEGGVVVCEIEAELIGAAVESRDHVGFALDPAGVIGRGAGQRGVEERLRRLAEPANVDDECVAAGDGEFAEQNAELPGVVVIEAREEKFGLLMNDVREVLSDSHACKDKCRDASAGGALTEERRRAGAGEVFLRFLRMGCTSFGGPVAHLGYFRAEFVDRLRWLDEAAFAEVVGLCQSLPGPASSQVGFTLGLMEAGPAGGAAAWLGFTTPSAMLMLAFAYGHAWLDVRWGAGLLHGLMLAAVAVVAQAVWSMAHALAPDWTRRLIAAAAAAMVLLLPSARAQLVALSAGALAGLLLCRGVASGRGELRVLQGRASTVAAAMFVALFAVPPLLHTAATQLFAGFYRTGALVFGGGHVVLPLLERVTVARGWVSEEAFLAGYGAAQAVPGPLFSFAAYLGTVSKPLPGLAGGAIALAAIFLPGLLLVVAVLPWWSRLRGSARMQAAIAGVNASVVGLLLAALYRPVWTSAVHSAWDVAIAVAGFALLAAGKARPILVVALAALIGLLRF
jgi:chromate transporter